jgi:elongation factor P
MVNSSDLKRGLLLEIDDAPWVIVDCSFQTPSARGASTITKIKIRNLKTNAVLQKSYRGGEMLKEADCERRNAQYLYKEGDDYIFMNTENYEQVPVSKEVIGDSAPYMMLNSQYKLTFCDGQPVGIDLPSSVVMTVVETAPR